MSQCSALSQLSIYSTGSLYESIPRKRTMADCFIGTGIIAEAVNLNHGLTGQRLDLVFSLLQPYRCAEIMTFGELTSYIDCAFSMRWTEYFTCLSRGMVALCCRQGDVYGDSWSVKWITPINSVLWTLSYTSSNIINFILWTLSYTSSNIINSILWTLSYTSSNIFNVHWSSTVHCLGDGRVPIMSLIYICVRVI